MPSPHPYRPLPSPSQTQPTLVSTTLHPPTPPHPYSQEGSRQWSLCFVDMAKETSNEAKSPFVSSLLAKLRRSPCAVVRKASRMIAYSGVASVRPIEEWRDRIKMGELSWEQLDPE